MSSSFHFLLFFHFIEFDENKKKRELDGRWFVLPLVCKFPERNIKRKTEIKCWREKKRDPLKQITAARVCVCVGVSLCVCVCVWKKSYFFLLFFFSHYELFLYSKETKLNLNQRRTTVTINQWENKKQIKNKLIQVFIKTHNRQSVTRIIKQINRKSRKVFSPQERIKELKQWRADKRKGSRRNNRNQWSSVCTSVFVVCVCVWRCVRVCYVCVCLCCVNSRIIGILFPNNRPSKRK